MISEFGFNNELPLDVSTSSRIFGPGRPDAGAPVCNPAIREVGDNVLVNGVGRVVEFAYANGYGRLWVQMVDQTVR